MSEAPGGAGREPSDPPLGRRRRMPAGFPNARGHMSMSADPVPAKRTRPLLAWPSAGTMLLALPETPVADAGGSSHWGKRECHVRRRAFERVTSLALRAVNERLSRRHTSESRSEVDIDTKALPIDGRAHKSSIGDDVMGFQVSAEVDGRLAIARWSPQRFSCDPKLLETAQVQVALGEIVGQDGSNGSFMATVSPDDPIALLLTLIRSGRVIECSLTLRWPSSGQYRGPILGVAIDEQTIGREGLSQRPPPDLGDNQLHR